MAPSSKVKHRFQNSLDMVAARSVFVDLTQPSGTDTAWSMVDSPTLGSLWSASKLPELPLERSTPPIPAVSVSVAPLQIKKSKPAPIDLSKSTLVPVEVKQVNVAPLNIKKMRRRGFSTSLRLVLPPSPLPPPRSPLGLPAITASPSSPLPPRSPFGLASTPTPQTALTFTAEWDLTQRTFVFTPFQSSYSPSALSPLPAVSPVPDDIATEVNTVSEPQPANHLPPLSSPVSPLDSPSIYSPSVSSVFSHRRNGSQSTAPSSATDISSKSDTYSPSLNRQMTLHLFKRELQRAIPSAGPNCDFDKECYEGMDEDLLMAPMEVFRDMLWESTDSEAPVAQGALEIPVIPIENKGQLQVSTNVSPLSKSRWSAESVDPSPQKGSPRTRKKRKFSQDLRVGGFVSIKL